MIFNKLIKQQENVIKIIEGIQKDKSQSLITYLNQHCFNFYNSNSDYKNLLDSKFDVFLDGFGIYAALKYLGFKNVQKFNATDLYTIILKHFSIHHNQIFLIGGRFGNELIEQKAEEKRLEVCGYQNGYFKNEEFDGIINNIRRASPEIVIIGMGVPKQEIIAARIADSIQNISILCVGNFFEFYFGTKKRLPRIFRSLGLEWIHRLIMEPGRLWKRYLIGIPSFINKIIRLKFSRKNYKIN